MPLSGTDLEPRLALLGSQCSAVVICRSSPSQKAAIVSMMTEYELKTAERGTTSKILRRWRRYQRKEEVRQRWCRMTLFECGRGERVPMQHPMPMWSRCSVSYADGVSKSE